MIAYGETKLTEIDYSTGSKDIDPSKTAHLMPIWVIAQIDQNHILVKIKKGQK